MATSLVLMGVVASYPTAVELNEFNLSAQDNLKSQLIRRHHNCNHRNCHDIFSRALFVGIRLLE